MKKLEMKTPDIVAKNLEKLASIFPHCITEDKDDDGNIIKSVNWDALVQEFANCPMSFGNEERYQFTWPDKRLAVVNANTPTTCTLRPVQADSLNFETTKNLYIEGDNLEVLKCLRETYLGKVKMIYIDPPYNTGNDFVYNDDFVQCTTEYLEHSGQLDTEGNRLVQNIDTNGRFHTDWLNMMYPRLKVARDLLSDDGVIFISIDENEVHNLRKICDEIFGASNYIATIAVINNFKGRSDDKYIATAHESLLIYHKGCFITNGVPLPEEYDQEYKLKDEMGRYRLQGLRKRGDSAKREDRPKMFYPFYYDAKKSILSLKYQQGAIEILPHLSDGTDGRWRWSSETAQERIDTLVAQKVKGREEYDIFQKDYLPQDGLKRIKPKSFWCGTEFSAETGTLEVKSIFEKKLFETPKPIGLLKFILQQASDNDSVILDFFSGSATTAHAVMQLNSEDNGNRKFIMVQLPELTDKKSEACKAGYKNICEIGKERIRRSGKKILDDLQAEIDKANAELAKLNEKAQQTTLDLGEPANDKLAELQNKIADLTARKEGLDVGFRVLRLDTSNMEDVFYRPADMENDTDLFTKAMQEGKLDSIKSDRNELDLLFQIMLELGILLSSPIEPIDINGKRAYSVNENFLIACFDKDINDDTIMQFAKLKPQFFVMRDSSASDDSVMTNFDQIFKQKSPQTQIRIL